MKNKDIQLEKFFDIAIKNNNTAFDRNIDYQESNSITSNRALIFIEELLDDYTNFLLKEQYCDSDAVCEKPRAVECYLNKVNNK